mmetsp:Transcript_7494/g.12484  ORF Transcript_7494/g.12484 Transcript_7494/m.12484 type:complete len:289 (+) Transcript_7494:25-891(+)|eukprot:CAMPEP_0119012656 /NCGR_PEP_ID=MMETSP1176-20130426/7172_1 /TAXON_ID=265551 /ORGANISM="Synedropsis recta cf, Strain CCMP1620" /LENGTH=288 /DNA_ID=CAMNT_0006965657 /DNA_START=28 /DNA_END=894 /DNA_ORIENTATION=+
MHQVCTSYAVREMLVQQYVKQEHARRKGCSMTTTVGANEGEGVLNKSRSRSQKCDGELLEKSRFSVLDFEGHQGIGNTSPLRTPISPSCDRYVHRASSKLSSFTLVPLSPKEEWAMKQESIERRRRGFDKMVGCVLGPHDDTASIDSHQSCPTILCDFNEYVPDYDSDLSDDEDDFPSSKPNPTQARYNPRRRNSTGTISVLPPRQHNTQPQANIHSQERQEDYYDVRFVSYHGERTINQQPRGDDPNEFFKPSNWICVAGSSNCDEINNLFHEEFGDVDNHESASED